MTKMMTTAMILLLVGSVIGTGYVYYVLHNGGTLPTETIALGFALLFLQLGIGFMVFKSKA